MAVVLEVVYASNDVKLIIWVVFLIQLSTRQKLHVSVLPSAKSELIILAARNWQSSIPLTLCQDNKLLTVIESHR